MPQSITASTKVFTTGQAAKIANVCTKTVNNWVDSGRMHGYRIPGTQARRIPREHLVRFLKEHGMPLGVLESESVDPKELDQAAISKILGSTFEALGERSTIRAYKDFKSRLKGTPEASS
jgi:excisionase family DNA binding protein